MMGGAMRLRSVMLAAMLLVAFSARLQAQPAPVTGFDPTKAAVQEKALLEKLGTISGVVSIPDQRAAVLIQPDGKLWRDYHRSVVPWLVGLFVLGTAAALAVFYLVRGRIRVVGGLSGITLPRFGGFERFMHWLTAGSWLVLALSGLNIAVGRIVLLPLIGGAAFSALSHWAKMAHNFIAFPFTLGIVLMLLVLLRHNIPGREDIEWFRQGGGLIGKGHPRAGRFNGGQKMVFWIVVLGGGIVAVSGFVLLFPFYTTGIAGMQTAQIVHGVLALLMIAAMLGHIYIGSVGMEGAFDAMGSGQVDRNWAIEHHAKWVDEVEQKSARAPAE